jgi:hypothetical protein
LEPLVDGNLQEWPPLRYRLDTDTTVLRYGHEQYPSVEDAAVLFDLRWTEGALYFAASMVDDVAWNDSPTVWQDDSVELYIDGDNDHSHPEYDANDHQLTVVRDARIGDHGTIIDPVSRGIRHAVRIGADDDFDLELSISWDQLGGPPAVGQVIGIDVAFNDDDDGEDEDTHLVMWLAHDMTELGSPVQDTTLFNDLTLGE